MTTRRRFMIVAVIGFGLTVVSWALAGNRSEFTDSQLYLMLSFVGPCVLFNAMLFLALPTPRLCKPIPREDGTVEYNDSAGPFTWLGKLLLGTSLLIGFGHMALLQVALGHW
jgi:hypothetical protein